MTNYKCKIDINFRNFDFSKIRNWFMLRLILLPIFIFILSNQLSEAQIKYRFFNPDKKEVDTLGIENAMKIAKETEGLLDREINPSEYEIGPNDKFLISIIMAESQEFEVIVNPEGKLIIPGIGMVDLKGLTLEESYNQIRGRIKQELKVNEIFIVLSDIRKFKVVVSGSVQRTSIVSAFAVDRVSEVIEKAGGPDNDASMRNIILYRARTNRRIPVDLMRFYLLGEKDKNPYVLDGDQIIVPQSSESESIQVSGEVPSPGEFEFVEGDSLSTLFKLGQGFLISSNLDSVEIARYDETGLRNWYVDVSSWKNKLYKGDLLDGDFQLKPGDRVFVRRIANWVKNKYAVIEGEVVYPGYYAIDEKTDKLSVLIKRAGGFTDEASLEASIMIRQSESENKDEELERLRRIPASEMSETEQQYFQSKIREKKGAMAIDFWKAMEDFDSEDNILLFHKDSIIVPQKKTFINVQGRVNNPGLVVYNRDLNYLDYINLSGGFGYRSDPDETLIVKSRGEIFNARSSEYIIEPGDNILVPPESDISFLDVFTDALTIATQLVTVVGVIITIVNLK